ncbi:MAG: sigma-70 family RNA polymerase sigma factor [Planctomycetota bacterium]
MNQSWDHSTSKTLLERLHDVEDHVARNEFFAKYTPAIEQFCRELGIGQQDLDDITQSIMLKLLSRMQSFQHDSARGKFRGYLRTVTKNAWIDFLKESKRTHAFGGSDHQLRLESISDQRFSEAIDRLFDEDIAEIATRRIRHEFSEEHWRVYRLIVVDGLTPKEIADQVGCSVGNVYVIKSRIQHRLMEIVREIDPES